MKFLTSILIFAATVLRASVNVTNYGATGDLIVLSNVSVTSNSVTITSSSASFVSGDVGKIISIPDAGIFRNPSNECLIAIITNRISGTSVQLNVAAGTTKSGLAGVYATDSRIGFSGAINAAAIPTDTVLIPAGNYLLINPTNQANSTPPVVAHRGGLSFVSQGSVILTGQGGWRDGALGTNASAQRNAILAWASPLTNYYPVVFSNLTFNGGTYGLDGHYNGGYVDPTTGFGWDTLHHAVVCYATNTPILTATNFSFYNVTATGFRGEVFIDDVNGTYDYWYATNVVGYDNNASLFNIPAPHTWINCVCSNSTFFEEYFRGYQLPDSQPSLTTGCVLSNLTGSAEFAMNGGGPYGLPWMVYSNNWFYGNKTNLQFSYESDPANDVLFITNRFYNDAGMGIGLVGYQGFPNLTANSNIVLVQNYFTNSGVVGVFGQNDGASATNQTYQLIALSNTLDHCGFIAGGYSAAQLSGSLFAFNVSSNATQNGFAYYPQTPSQFFFDTSNTYPSYIYQTTDTNIIYGWGQQATVAAGRSGGIYLDTVDVSRIPPGATLLVTNADAASPVTVHFSTTAPTSGSTNQPASSSAIYAWNGTYWTNGTPYVPPVILVGIYLPILR